MKYVSEVPRLKIALDLGVIQSCKSLGISTSQYYRWRDEVIRFHAGENDALIAKSRVPKCKGRITPAEVREEVIVLCKSGIYPSAKAIADKMRSGGSRITTKTVIEILEEEELYGWKIVIGRDGQPRKIRGIL